MHRTSSAPLITKHAGLAACLTVLVVVWAQLAVGQTIAWLAEISGGQRYTCGGPTAVSEWHATAESAAAAMCKQQSCGDSEVVDFAYRSSTGASFACRVKWASGSYGGLPFGLSTTRLATDEPKNAGACGQPGSGDRPCQQMTSYPINLGAGNKVQVEVDYTASGPYPLQFTHHYNSNTRVMAGKAMGKNRRHYYERSLQLMGGQPAVTASRADGRGYTFRLIGGVWTPDPGVVDRLIELPDTGGWLYIDGNDETETYDANGRLLAIANRAGLAHTLSYDTAGRMATVIDAFGNTLTFTYDAAGRVESMTDPAGGRFAYAYDAADNLKSITYPDGKTRTYHYEAPSGFTWLLTGITDENNSRFSTYGYATDQRSISTQHALGANRLTVQYSGINVTVTDAFDVARDFTHKVIQGVVRNTGVNLPCSTCQALSYGYDANGFVAYKLDFNRNRTNYARNARGLEIQRVEGLASDGAFTAVTRTANTEWHSDYRLPTRIAEPNRITKYAYGAPTDSNPGNRGNLLVRTIEATNDTNGSQGFAATATGAAARVWTYSYNANGQILTVDGPRTDIADVTSYAYYDSAVTCATTLPGASVTGCRGQVQTIINAAGHVTTIAEYNGHGQPLKIVDPNGLVTTLRYDGRMRLTSRSVGGETTAYAYDGVGQITRVTSPDGSYLNYTYDAAHRLIAISDSVGNKVAYTLDAMGNRVAEQVYDPNNVLAQRRTRVYSSLNRLSQEIGASNQTTTYGYDSQGNVTSVDGALAGGSDTTTKTYDALNRLIRVTDPASGEVNYGYDGLNQLISVSDPRKLTTTYGYDGLSNLKQLASPDTGVTVNVYDAVGNVVSSTDAKGQTTTYRYDALNRIAAVIYAGGITHTFQYDQGAYGNGRLTQISDPDSTTDYAYDQKGRLTSETRTIPKSGGAQYTTRYSYDAFGRLTGITYPGGREVAYALDNLGRTQQVTTAKAGVTQTVVSNVAYRPFGPAMSFAFGNGQTYARGFDLDGRITSYTLATQTVPVRYDDANRITSLGANTYGYDLADRLSTAAAQGVNQTFTYDVAGNRLSLSGASSATYTYSQTSNRLMSVSGANGRSYGYDANGSVLSDGLNTLSYDTRGRLNRAAANVTTDYKVNALGQRIRKTNGEGDTVYHYDRQGRLIAESTASGFVAKQYLYLGDMLVAIINESTPTKTTPGQPSYTGRSGDGVTVTVNIAGSAPTGTVTFREGNETLGSAPIVNGSASVTLTNLSVGQHTITAEYSGDSNNASSSTSFQIDVQPGLTWLPAILQLLLEQ